MNILNLKPYALFLDDCRFPEEAFCSFSHFPLHHVSGVNNDDWLVVRSVKEFEQALMEHGLPEVVSFDHDLDYGKENVHIQEYIRASGQGRPLNRYILKDTGLEAAQFLIEYCKKNSLTLPRYFVHSANDLGAEDILKELKKYENFAKSLQSPYLGEKSQKDS